MALTDCCHCDKCYNEKLDTCPHCGYSIWRQIYEAKEKVEKEKKDVEEKLEIAETSFKSGWKKAVNHIFQNYRVFY